MLKSHEQFMTQSVLSQHLTSVWQQHYYQIIKKAPPPYLIETVALINRELATLANLETPIRSSFEVIKELADQALEIRTYLQVHQENPSEPLADGITDNTITDDISS